MPGARHQQRNHQVRRGVSVGRRACAPAVLLALFVAFNILEASLPSLVSRVARPESRGTALGVYNTTQSLGLFAGGALGGWLAQHFGEGAVFVFGIAVVALWLGATYGMCAPGDAVDTKNL